MGAAHRRPIRIVAGHRKPTGDPMLDLVAAIFRRAVSDAERCHRDENIVDAEIFLDFTFPEWRKFQEEMTDDE